MNGKKLTRSTSDRWLAGVCGGLGEYFGIDPVAVRVGYIVLLVLTGGLPLVVAYVLLAIVMPAGPTAIGQSPAVPAVADEAAAQEALPEWEEGTGTGG